MNIPSTLLIFFNPGPSPSFHYFNFSPQQTSSLTSPISKMSDTLADLASWLPSEFLTGDMDDKPLFLNNHNTRRVPYDFASSSSTESESDDDDFAGLTRRFTRSVSLQERLKIPYPAEKRVFSPESTLNWNFSGQTHVRSSPTTSFLQADEDAWDLIYAAAGQVARMKMNNVNDTVFVNRGFLGAPRPVAPNFSHHNRNRAIWRSENEALIRPQQYRERLSGGSNYGSCGRFVSGRPVGFGQSAWPPHPIETQRRQQPADVFTVKPVLGRSSGGRTIVKKGCAGTGVFLPRSYINLPSESNKKPARVAQSFNKNMDPILAHPQANIPGVFSRPPHHINRDDLAEKIMVYRQNSVMLLQQRREGVAEARMGQAEVVLPQEWTY
ncbi:hypothetical protein L1987_35194 [Smallanthus sonchifolius]|uniref:Uncharacterized protein n=1 Tax=Smallanthus sonchifolius TaxID=185202 RepID=A0ACB9HVS9_9ASTR|nr:hypothetical protein L1987_35194 [Smallanthus sonchifolius]